MGTEVEPRLYVPRGCGHVRWLVGVWQKRAYEARQDYYRWRESHWVLKDFKVASGNNAWQRAVREAQKAYPGTEWWLLSCSSTEGGWGRWVPNSDGYPPGGWMQMYESTWRRMWGLDGHSGAKQDLARKGYKVPASAESWYSPLGQALASAWGFTHGRRGEWNSSGC